MFSITVISMEHAKINRNEASCEPHLRALLTTSYEWCLRALLTRIVSFERQAQDGDTIRELHVAVLLVGAQWWSAPITEKCSICLEFELWFKYVGRSEIVPRNLTSKARGGTGHVMNSLVRQPLRSSVDHYSLRRITKSSRGNQSCWVVSTFVASH